jgi:hypothetical protein
MAALDSTEFWLELVDTGSFVCEFQTPTRLEIDPAMA